MIKNLTFLFYSSKKHTLILINFLIPVSNNNLGTFLFRCSYIRVHQTPFFVVSRLKMFHWSEKLSHLFFSSMWATKTNEIKSM